jgi:hypothetical protein
MKVLQTSPFPLGYRASDAQYSETSQRFQHAMAAYTLRIHAQISAARRIVSDKIERLLRQHRSR